MEQSFIALTSLRHCGTNNWPRFDCKIKFGPSGLHHESDAAQSVSSAILFCSLPNRSKSRSKSSHNFFSSKSRPSETHLSPKYEVLFHASVIVRGGTSLDSGLKARACSQIFIKQVKSSSSTQLFLAQG